MYKRIKIHIKAFVYKQIKNTQTHIQILNLNLNGIQFKALFANIPIRKNLRYFPLRHLSNCKRLVSFHWLNSEIRSHKLATSTSHGKSRPWICEWFIYVFKLRICISSQARTHTDTHAHKQDRQIYGQINMQLDWLQSW